MKINHLCFSKKGGAGEVASLLQSKQLDLGISSNFIFANEDSLKDSPISKPLVTVASVFDEFFFKNSSAEMQFSLLRNRIDSVPLDALLEAEINHLHWTNGLLNPNSLTTLGNATKLIITLHDMNFFTGGCHHSLECSLFKDTCGSCPNVRNFAKKLVRSDYQSKKNFFNSTKICLTAPSDWIARKAAESSLVGEFKISKIRNPIHENFFKVSPFYSSRNEFHLDNDDLVFAIVATDLLNPNKGVKSVVELFSRLKSQTKNEKIKLILIGENGKRFQNFPGVLNFGRLNLSSYIKVIANADYLISFSRAENAPMVIAEASALGIPTIAKSVGGVDEMILDLNYGHSIKDEVHLFKFMHHVSSNQIKLSPSERQKLSQRAGKIYSLSAINKEYLELYSS